MSSSAVATESGLLVDTLSVSEIFYSVQGEGPLVGSPAVFLRLGYCSLHCTWCDTKYTWDWVTHDPRKEIHRTGLAEVLSQISRYDCQHLVVTGGEPLLQQGRLLPLLHHLHGAGFFIEVETSGTIRPRERLCASVDQWNVSPKLENSGNARAEREVGDVLIYLSSLPNAYFKFVLVSHEDIREVVDLVDRYAMRPDHVFLMPEAASKETLRKRAPWVARLSEENGFRFTTRLQIELFDGQRGH